MMRGQPSGGHIFNMDGAGGCCWWGCWLGGVESAEWVVAGCLPGAAGCGCATCWL